MDYVSEKYNNVTKTKEKVLAYYKNKLKTDKFLS
jgi:hypothetical protein